MTAQTAEGPAQKDRWYLRPLWVLLWILVGCVTAAFFLAPSTSETVDATKMLTLVSGTAVAIERLIELAWTAVGQLRKFGGWWPLGVVTQAMQRFEDETNRALAGTVGGVKDEIADLLTGTQDAEAKLRLLNAQFAKVEAVAGSVGTAFAKELERLTASLPPGSARLAAVSKAAQSGYQQVDAVVDEVFGHEKALAAMVKTRLAALHSGADAALGIVESFSDNPARKIASLLLGMSAGVVAVSVMGLNMVTAVLGADAASGALSGTGGVVATGLVVGLGANPTHEVIKILTKIKQRNAVGTVVSDVTDSAASAPDPGTSPASSATALRTVRTTD